MATGGKVATKKQTVQLKRKGVDESDEDYAVGEDDELDESEDEYCYSLAVDGGGSLAEFEEAKAKRRKKVNKVGRPSGGGRGAVEVRKKSAAYRVEHGGLKGRKKGKKEVFDGEVRVTNLSNEGADGPEGKKQKRKLKSSKRTVSNKPKKQLLRRRNTCPVEESRAEGPVSQKTKRGRGNGGGIKKFNVTSDSDSVASGYPGAGYTISEEEREQIREAKEICKSLTNDLRSSYLKTIKDVPSRNKTKEMEDMVDVKMKAGKQVCGICLSEEGKRTVRGKLNCCSHYFCFACIMEWSKVESRCPLCKQRFETICRTAQVVGEHGSMDVIIPVPECDQVYEPSVEELRGYFDPYEDVLCSECHQGWDDALMLLCDICDSSAHTYCVGLGREVPEGSWYCIHCRTIVLASSNSHALSTPHETFDLNELYVSDTQYHRETLPSVSPSPRYSVGVSQAASHSFGSVALTLSERRRIQQQIHHILINRRSQQTERSGTMSPVSGASRGEIAHFQAAPAHRTPQNMGRLPISMSWSGQAVHHHEASTSTGGNPCNGISNTRGPPKELVQSMVRSHLKSLSRDFDLGYARFKYFARRCTHTILAAFGLEHRGHEVYRVQTRPLICNHVGRKWEVAGQCSSCLDCFTGSVVRAIFGKE